MDNFFASMASQVMAFILIGCGLLFDIAILFRWRRLPKAFSTGYKLICLLVGSLTIYSGVMVIVIHRIAVKP